MRFRALPLLAALTSAIAFGSASHAAAADTTLCVSINGVLQVGCTSEDPTAPAPAADAPAAPSAAATLCPGADLVPSAANLAQVKSATVCLVNHERTSRGLKPLRAVGTLGKVAVSYSNKMVAQKFFDHTAPDGTTFASRIKHTSYLRGSWRRWSIGENIAWGTDALATPGGIVEAWMHSAGHRANILNGAFTEMGLGVAAGSPDSSTGDAGAGTYTQDFGLRRR